MKQFIKDIFSEEIPGMTKSGKFSAKRFMDVTVGLGALLGSIISGLHFYEVSADIINPMWIFSGSMLGVSAIKSMAK